MEKSKQISFQSNVFDKQEKELNLPIINKDPNSTRLNIHKQQFWELFFQFYKAEENLKKSETIKTW